MPEIVQAVLLRPKSVSTARPASLISTLWLQWCVCVYVQRSRRKLIAVPSVNTTSKTFRYCYYYYCMMNRGAQTNARLNRRHFGTASACLQQQACSIQCTTSYVQHLLRSRWYTSWSCRNAMPSVTSRSIWCLIGGVYCCHVSAEFSPVLRLPRCMYCNSDRINRQACISVHSNRAAV
jgi:hypothetical protein